QAEDGIRDFHVTGVQTCALPILPQLVGVLGAGGRRHVGVDALALDVVRHADHGGLGHLRVEHQRALDLGGAHAVAGDVDHVVDPPGEPVVAVLVAPRAGAGEVPAGVPAGVGLGEPPLGRVGRAHHAGPGRGDHR